MNRCPWCLINELETKYHDEEWGVPVYDDIKQFEYLMLEVMQCGLSWDTILKKREIFVLVLTVLIMIKLRPIPQWM